MPPRRPAAGSTPSTLTSPRGEVPSPPACEETRWTSGPPHGLRNAAAEHQRLASRSLSSLETERRMRAVPNSIGRHFPHTSSPSETDSDGEVPFPMTGLRLGLVVTATLEGRSVGWRSINQVQVSGRLETVGPPVVCQLDSPDPTPAEAPPASLSNSAGQALAPSGAPTAPATPTTSSSTTSPYPQRDPRHVGRKC